MTPDRERAERWLERREERRGLRPRDAALMIVIAWLAAVVLWGVLEHLIDPDTFPTIWLGMWWALQTVTTVGYGDIVPESTAGRGVATLLLLGGLAFLSVITATITSGFIARAQRSQRRDVDLELLAEVRDLHRRLDELQGGGGPGPASRSASPGDAPEPGGSSASSAAS